MGHAIHNIYDNDGYQFFYVCLVTDKSAKAMARVNSTFNLVGYPSAYFDAGHEVFVGGSPDLDDYRPLIESSGARAVMDIDLSLEMTWLGNGEIQLDLTMTNHEMINDEPDDPTVPEVISDGCINIEYPFSTSAVDPEGDQVYYRYDFSDGLITDWFGPYNSGEVHNTAHAWTEVGNYTVKVQSKDIYDQETAWGETSSINMHGYLSGDPNGDLLANILDVVFLIKFKYQNGPPPDPYESGDVNGNIIVNILDITYLINFLYMGGPIPVYSS